MRRINRRFGEMAMAAGFLLVAGCSGSDTGNESANIANAADSAPTTRTSTPAPIIDDVTVVDVKGPSSRRYVAGQVIGTAPIRLGPGDAITLNVDGLIYKYTGPGVFTPGQIPPRAATTDSALPDETASGQLPSFVDDSGIGPGEPGYGGDSAGGSGGSVGSGGDDEVALPEAVPAGADPEVNPPPQ